MRQSLSDGSKHPWECNGTATLVIHLDNGDNTDMTTFLVTIRLNQPDGHTTHNMFTEGNSMEEVMVRFGMASDGNDFMAVKAFRPRVLTEGESYDRYDEYGVVFPLSSVREVIYTEV